MPLPFHPNQGLIVICDFEGMKAPEMVKRRPAIVLTPRRRGGDRLTTILPVSTTPPGIELEHHYNLFVDPALPQPYTNQNVWVKCDMVYTVSLDRLNLPWYKAEGGKRQYVTQYIEQDDLEAVQRCLLTYLGFKDLARFL